MLDAHGKNGLGGADDAATAGTPAPLEVSVTHTEGTAVVTFRGDLDLSTQGQLRQTLADMVRLKPALVEVDLSRVAVFDCGAIGELLRARSALRDLGSTLVLRAPSPTGLRVLETIGLVDLIPISPRRNAGWPADPGDPAATATEVIVLTDAWRTACETHETMSWPVVFRQPERIVGEMLQALDVERPASEVPTISHCLPDTLSQDAPVARYAVQQLLELRRVMQAWIGWGAFPPARHRELQRRLSTALDASIVEVVSAALTELEYAALLDPLTGLMNRRALDRDLAQFLASARRHDRALTVVMLDVVGLKRTNDRLGHEAGDDLLQDVAAALVGTLRVGDNVYRIGGDEFVLLLPDLRPEDVDAVMDRAVVGAGGSFTWGSAGVPTDFRAEAETPASLLKLADERMLAFRAGRVRGDTVEWGHPSRATQVRFAGDSPRAVHQLKASTRLNSVTEQAKGMLAEHFGLDIESAAELMADFSRRRDQSVRRTAYGLVDRTIKVADLAPPQVRV